jgi:hypothetical protein
MGGNRLAMHVGLHTAVFVVLLQTDVFILNERRKKMDYNETYPHRSMVFFKDETKGDHAKRMRKAELYGRFEKCPRFAPMVAEHLVNKDATVFATALHRLGLKFKQLRGVGKDSFLIEG